MEALVLAVVIIYLVERLRPLGDRVLRLHEQQKAPLPPGLQYPLDIERHIRGQSEPWAREQVEEYVKEQFAEHRGDWNQVRQNLGLPVSRDGARTVH